MIAAKIAAHATDLARGLKGVAERDRILSIARFDLDWKKHIAESLDRQQWCSLRINREIKKMISR